MGATRGEFQRDLGWGKVAEGYVLHMIDLNSPASSPISVETPEAKYGRALKGC